MAVIRFDPFRTPLERLLSMAATGTRAPARHAYGRLPRRGWQLPRRGQPAGVDPDSIEVTVEHSTRTIRAGRTPHHGDSEQVIVAERPGSS
jgi:HSP20 family protein